jgi:WD40 repeat protein
MPEHSTTNLPLDALEGFSAAFSADGERFALASNFGFARVWRTASWREEVTLRGFLNYASSVAFSPDGRLLAAGPGASNEIRVWDVSTQQWRFDLRGHTDFVMWVCFTPDGQTLASASHDRTIKLWSIETGQELLSLPQAAGVFQTVFSGDGRILAAGTYGSEGTNYLTNVKLIRAPSLEEIAAAEAKDKLSSDSR